MSEVLEESTNTFTAAASDASRPVVDISGVRFTWPGAKGFTLTIDSFSLPRGERLLLIGPSGTGKSTFLSLLAGINVPGEGAISILGTDVVRLSSAARDHFRAEHMGIIFQMFNLLPYGSVIDNVVLPLSFAADRRRRVERVDTMDGEARRLLESLGLARDDYEGTSAANLSVGQQQRVACARALIGRPELIVADEPTSSLDRDTQLAFLDLLFTEVEHAGSSLIMVSHDQSLASRFDRAIRLDAIARTSRGRGRA